MSAKFIWSILFVLALAVNAGLVTGCEHGVAKQTMPPAVTVAPVEQKEVVEWSEFTGRVEPVDSVEVRPRVSGYIQEVRFQSGQLVKAPGGGWSHEQLFAHAERGALLRENGNQ